MTYEEAIALVTAAIAPQSLSELQIQEPVFYLQVYRARLCPMAQRVQLPAFKTGMWNELSPDSPRWHYPMDWMRQVCMIRITPYPVSVWSE
jgi:hypothetical protein